MKGRESEKRKREKVRVLLRNNWGHQAVQGMVLGCEWSVSNEPLK